MDEFPREEEKQKDALEEDGSWYIESGFVGKTVYS